MTQYIFEHNPLWADWYTEEAAQIESETPISIKLFHIGSTAIPNMFAKECIDMLGEIESYEEGNKLIEPLKKLGFEYRGEYGIKSRHYFSKTNPRKVHCHIFVKGSVEIDKHQHFVDVMANHPELVAELIEIKKDLQSLYPNDKNRYQQEKSFFYEKINSY